MCCRKTKCTRGPAEFGGRVLPLSVPTMVVYDNSALRAQVISDYKALTRGVSDATELRRIFETIRDTAVGTVRMFMRDFNKESLVERLPAEVLTACFLLLPFHSRIRASHVCRSWRTAALAHRDVWSNITISYLDLKLDDIYPTAMAAIDTVLKPYWHHIRLIELYVDERSSMWKFPAARLEYLHSYGGPQIRRDFLGSRVGRLRSLHIGGCTLPPDCPAISTVVDLRIRDMKRVKDIASFGRLFVLFPRLEQLSLCGLDARFSAVLPAGPAPSSLRGLILEVDSMSFLSYDLIQHYIAWETGNLHTVSLSMHYSSGLNLREFLRDALTLTIGRSNGTDGLCVLTSEHPNSTTRSLRMTANSLPAVSGLVFAVKAVLQDLHSLRISAVALESFIPVLAVLDSLTHLTIQVVAKECPGPIHPENALPRDYALDWKPLITYLPRLEYFVLRLESITVQVMRQRWDPARPANLHWEQGREYCEYVMSIIA
ncbi:hypothetical protein AURDEDRAFT_164479 [Auricularia subglabra TFB-10046 SS5]|nr:hypothetical protein AURDEDRAFT_164479 [Auricularia subglabra TFB-10046 SS5]